MAIGQVGMALLAQAEGGDASPSPLNPFLLLGGMIALFYFIVLAPERRRKAEEAARLAAIKKNDRIVTVGGIHGVVAAINDGDTLTVRIDESSNTRIKIDRKAVARVSNDKGKESPS